MKFFEFCDFCSPLDLRTSSTKHLTFMLDYVAEVRLGTAWVIASFSIFSINIHDQEICKQ